MVGNANAKVSTHQGRILGTYGIGWSEAEADFLSARLLR